jgi:uncharacterized protein YycO
MIITIALKKTCTLGFTDKIISKSIQWWTKSPYFHVEMIIKEKWISTNPSVGTVYIRDLEQLKTNYDYYDVEVDGRKLKQVMTFINSQVGKKYDYWGILMSTVINANKEDKEKWFCSELISAILTMFNISSPKNANQMTPADIHILMLRIANK